MSEPLTAPLFDEHAKVWSYPDSWTPEQRRAWEGIQGRKIAETAQFQAIADQRAAAASSPDALLAAARAEADAAQRAREVAERAAKSEKAVTTCREQLGAAMRAIPTVEGDVIIVRTMTQQEIDLSNFRATNLVQAAKGNAMQAHGDFVGAHRDALLATVVYPPRDRTKELTKLYPGLWKHMEIARDELIDGRRTDEGKEPAL